jgi:hypothetical protein
MWSDISTVPKDGAILDLWHKNGFRITDVWFDDEDQVWTCLLPESDFTHWMLVEPPLAAPNKTTG